MKNENDQWNRPPDQKGDGAPGIRKYLRKIFRKFSQQQRNLQINCQQGMTINLCVIDAKKENIENLIMEYNNILKSNQL
jgi:hypothetical protein